MASEQASNMVKSHGASGASLVASGLTPSKQRARALRRCECSRRPPSPSRPPLRGGRGSLRWRVAPASASANRNRSRNRKPDPEPRSARDRRDQVVLRDDPELAARRADEDGGVLAREELRDVLERG